MITNPTEKDFTKFKKSKTMQLPRYTEESAEFKTDATLLYECMNHWSNLRELRERTARALRYVRGDQWKDFITDPKTGKQITEEDYIKGQGKIPLKQNQIRQLMNNRIGQYRSNPTKSVVFTRRREDAPVAEMFSNSLECSLQLNQAKRIDIRNFEMFLSSGTAFWKTEYDYWANRNIEDVLITCPTIFSMFFNTDMEDHRYRDLRIIGQLVDSTIDDVVRAYAKTPAQERKIRSIYSTQSNQIQSNQLLAKNRVKDFLSPKIGMCRVIQVWYQKGSWKTYVHDTMDGTYNVVEQSVEQIGELNRQRIEAAAQIGIEESDVRLMTAEPKFEMQWYVKHLSTSGHVLYEGLSPYEHEEHPYTLLLYPLMDGEVWGWVEDIIDQQRYVNRLMTMMNMIMSDKGALMIPSDSIPDDMSPEDFAEQHEDLNGIIVYKPNVNRTAPQHIQNNSTAAGLGEIFTIQMNLLKEIGGTGGAIQGIAPSSGTPSSRYAMEAQNSSINSIDTNQTFAEAIKERDLKIIKLQRQFYDQPRHLAISGKVASEDSRTYDPRLAKVVEIDMTVAQSTDTPMFRMEADNMLLDMVKSQMIDTKLFLEHCSWPFADKLLDAIEKREQDPNAQIPPEVNQMVSQNPKAQQMLSQAIGR